MCADNDNWLVMMGILVIMKLHWSGTEKESSSTILNYEVITSLDTKWPMQ
jgi:hypothetical protein